MVAKIFIIWEPNFQSREVGFRQALQSGLGGGTDDITKRII
jgi:hypothetical protein